MIHGNQTGCHVDKTMMSSPTFFRVQHPNVSTYELKQLLLSETNVEAAGHLLKDNTLLQRTTRTSAVICITYLSFDKSITYQVNANTLRVPAALPIKCIRACFPFVVRRGFNGMLEELEPRHLCGCVYVWGCVCVCVLCTVTHQTQLQETKSLDQQVDVYFMSEKKLCVYVNRVNNKNVNKSFVKYIELQSGEHKKKD